MSGEDKKSGQQEKGSNLYHTRTRRSHEEKEQRQGNAGGRFVQDRDSGARGGREFQINISENVSESHLPSYPHEFYSGERFTNQQMTPERKQVHQSDRFKRQPGPVPPQRSPFLKDEQTHDDERGPQMSSQSSSAEREENIYKGPMMTSSEQIYFGPGMTSPMSSTGHKGSSVNTGGHSERPHYQPGSLFENISGQGIQAGYAENNPGSSGGVRIGEFFAQRSSPVKTSIGKVHSRHGEYERSPGISTAGKTSRVQVRSSEQYKYTKAQVKDPANKSTHETEKIWESPSVMKKKQNQEALGQAAHKQRTITSEDMKSTLDDIFPNGIVFEEDMPNKNEPVLSKTFGEIFTDEFNGDLSRILERENDPIKKLFALRFVELDTPSDCHSIAKHGNVTFADLYEKHSIELDEAFENQTQRHEQRQESLSSQEEEEEEKEEPCTSTASKLPKSSPPKMTEPVIVSKYFSLRIQQLSILIMIMHFRTEIRQAMIMANSYEEDAYRTIKLAENDFNLMSSRFKEQRITPFYETEITDHEVAKAKRYREQKVESAHRLISKGTTAEYKLTFTFNKDKDRYVYIGYGIATSKQQVALKVQCVTAKLVLRFLNGNIDVITSYPVTGHTREKPRDANSFSTIPYIDTSLILFPPFKDIVYSERIRELVGKPETSVYYDWLVLVEAREAILKELKRLDKQINGRSILDIRVKSEDCKALQQKAKKIISAALKTDHKNNLKVVEDLVTHYVYDFVLVQ